MRRITSADLAAWAPTRDCQEHLPLLIRKLIRASGLVIEKMMIPVGDNINLPGYDGTLKLETGNEFIPPGDSVLEIGTSKDYAAKATKDLAKRTTQITAEAAAETNFIFVTPYLWLDKESWIIKADPDNVWKKIIVIDALMLEQWVEALPVIGYWLAKFLRFPSANTIPLDQFWQEWSSNAKYTISPALVISGRNIEVADLSEMLFADPATITIKGPTTDEVMAFVAATISTMDDNAKEELFAKTAIIYNEDDFRPLIHQTEQMILIAAFQGSGIIDQAVKNGHRVIIPVATDLTASKEDILLSRIRRTGFEKSLTEMGFTSDEADQLTRDSGQSLSVLRRLLNFEKNLQPQWAREGNHAMILPALMAGIWNEDNEEDKTIIALFAGEPYEKYIAGLNRWKVAKDPPVFRIGAVWRMTSLLDAWSVLAPFISGTDLQNFKNGFLTVMREVNPALSLEPEKRYLGSFYGKTPKFSNGLKEGLCHSLILLAVFGEQFKVTGTENPQEFADHLVRELLAGAAGEKWCSLHMQLRFLAEASPSSFLSAVEHSLSETEPPVMQMFGDMHSIINSTAYYTGLLWALENLLFSDEYILRATMVLAHLAELDPGGKLRNRPLQSLTETYTPWYNQTRASLEIRKNVLRKLAGKFPRTAWNVFVAVSPRGQMTVSPISRCRWRFDSQHLERTVLYEEIWDFQDFVFKELMSLALDEKKIAQLAAFYPDMTAIQKNELLAFLKEAKEKTVHEENLLWNKLRHILARHQEFSAEPWALTGPDLDKLTEIYDLFTPDNLRDRYIFLFEEGWPEIPLGKRRRELSTEERDKLNNDNRVKAVREIYDAEGIEGITQMIPKLSNTFNLARTTVMLNLPDTKEAVFFKYLSKDQTDKKSLFVQNYISFKAFSGDSGWLQKAWNEVAKIHSDNETLACFFIYLQQRRDIWTILETADPAIQKIYWEKLNAHLYYEDKADKIFVINKLMEVKRYQTVLDEIAGVSTDFSSPELVDILTKAASEPAAETRRVRPHDIGAIFETLYARNDIEIDVLTRLEWLYLSFLADRFTAQKPRYLLAELTNNPLFFVEVVSLIYSPDDREEDENLSEEQLKKRYQRADSSRKLLDSWREIPGMDDKHSIDVAALMKWINTALTKGKELKRVYGVNSAIGEMLAHYPRNNTAWPSDEICEVIDRLDNRELLSHFETEIINSRGMTSRHPYAGGDQERNLADWFEKMGTRIQSKYPLTASVLSGLAKRYRKDAKEEDDRARMDELR